MRSFKVLLKILRTAVVFLLTVSLLSAFFIACYLRGENFHYQDERERTELSGDVTLLITGASYALFGIRADVINDCLGVNAYNLSGTLLTLRGRYELLQEELERNPKVHTVILEVSPDTLLRDRAEEGPKGDLPMLGRITDVGRRWDYFRAAFTVSEWPEVYYDLVSKGIDAAIRLVNGTYTTKNEYMVFGYYVNQKPDKPIDDNYREVYHVHALPEEILPENVEWLEKLIALCREHGATPYLIAVPQSKYYNCLYRNLDYFETWFRDFAAEQEVAYFNFNLARSKLELLPDETCFYDDTHLNALGGEVFSKMLADVIHACYHGKDRSYAFYSDYEALTWNSGYFD